MPPDRGNDAGAVPAHKVSGSILDLRRDKWAHRVHSSAHDLNLHPSTDGRRDAPLGGVPKWRQRLPAGFARAILARVVHLVDLAGLGSGRERFSLNNRSFGVRAFDPVLARNRR
jgi:hypothetical protein